MAISALLQSIYEGVNAGVTGDLSLACEIYEPDVLPGADGFDPADALDCFAGTTFEYRGRTYKRLVKKWGEIARSTGPQFNSVSLTFANDADKYMASLMLAQPLGTFEGYHLVIRILSRGSSVNLDDSDIRFVGKIDKPSDISREDFPLSAKEHIGTIDVSIPRRKFGYDDLEGRAPEHAEFEGFRFLPTTGELTFKSRERRTDILGLFGMKKTVTKTLQYSSHSALDAGRSVPLVFGRCQMLGIHIGFADVGNSIPMLTAWADGGRYGIWEYENVRKVSPGFTPLVTLGAAPTYRYGTKGGTGDQFPVPAGSAADKIGNGYYSYTAWTYTFVNGSELDQDDPAPDLAAIIFGCIIPLPDSTGAFTETGFSDNPAYIARFILTDPFLMNIDPAFIDDAVCWETGKWCDQYIEDYNQTDTVQLPDSQEGIAGTNYHLYKSSSFINTKHFKYLLGLDENPYLEEVDYQFFENTGIDSPFEPPEPKPIPLPLTPRFYMRRRYTANVPITETQKAIDFLNNVLFPGTALYLTQGANGKIQIRVKKPVDFALVRGSSAIGVTEIPVDSVLPWVNSLAGKILIGANLLTSEIRKPTGWRYTTAGNAITLAKTGNVTLSGATFSGGNNTTTPASATLTFTGGGVISVTIDGITLTHVAFGLDTTSTLAGWFSAAINAHPTLGRYIKATWDISTPTVVTLTSKMGFIQFTTPLENTHSAAEEVLRIKASFSTGAASIADLQRSNVLDNSFRWPIGGRQSSYNVVELSYRDSSQDWRYTTLRVKSDPHIAQVKKRIVKEVDGSCIDNQNQASRRANQILAELRDCDFFVQHASDGEALTVEEGDVICVNTEDFVNLPIRVEDLRLSPDLAVGFLGRRYLNSIFSDIAEERTVPIPTILSYTNLPPPVATNLVLTETGAYGPDGTWQPRLTGVFDFGDYAGPQMARVKLDRAGGTAYKDTNNLIRPDENGQGRFEIDVSKGLHSVQVIVENRYGDKASSGHPTDSKNIVGLAPAPSSHAGGATAYDPIAGEIRGSWTPSVSTDVGRTDVYLVSGGVETFQKSVGANQNFFTIQPPTNWSGAIVYKVYARNRSGTISATGLTLPSISPPALPAATGLTFTQAGNLRHYTINGASAIAAGTFKGFKVATLTIGNVPVMQVYDGNSPSFTLDLNRYGKTSLNDNLGVATYDIFGNVGGYELFDYASQGTPPAPLTTSRITVDYTLCQKNSLVIHVTSSDDPTNVVSTRVQMRAVGGSWPTSGTTRNLDGQVEMDGLHREIYCPKLISQQAVEIRVGIEFYNGGIQYTPAVTHLFWDDVQASASPQFGGVDFTVEAHTTDTQSFSVTGVNTRDVVEASPSVQLPSGLIKGEALVVDDGGLVAIKVANVTAVDIAPDAVQWNVNIIKKRPLYPEQHRGLVAHWRMNEASSTRYDVHGSNHLTDNNTVTQAAGKIGSAALFTAANSEYLSLADNAAMSVGDIDFTFTVWIYMTTLGAHRPIIMKSDFNTQGEYGLFYNVSTGRLQFYIHTPSGLISATANSLGAPLINAWYFIRCWHDSVANTVNIQVNNGPVDSTATAGAAPSDSSLAFALGNVTTIYFDGRMDSVCFWKRVLTSAEATLLYASGNGLDYPF